MKILQRYLMPIVIVSLLLSCSNKDLSRSHAQTSIMASDEIQKLTKVIPMHSGAYNKGEKQGLWRSRQIAEKGKEVFSEVTKYRSTLHQPASIEVSITGIAGVPTAENMKEVQFEWTYHRMPDLAKRFTISGGTGKAIFRQFDDGWRLEKVNLSESSEPYPLTTQEMNDEKADISAFAEKQTKLKAELQRLVKESKTPKNKILEYSTGDVFFKHGGGGTYEIKSIILYDTEIYIDALPKPKDIWKFRGEPIHIQFKTDSYTAWSESSWGGQCSAIRGALTGDAYRWILLSDRYESYPKRLYFLKKEECLKFKQKFEETYQNWRNIYGAAFKTLAEMQ